MNSPQPKQKVIFDHDGGVDDLLSLMLLLTMEHIQVLAVTITPADCYLPDALISTRKILAMFKRDNVIVAAGNIHGVNAFPADWRAQPKICNAMPEMLLQPFDHVLVDKRDACTVIADLLEQFTDVTLLMTGPCSNLQRSMEQNPQIKSHIKELIWMGGAVDVPGNVAMHNHNKSAEWNAFWDPVATQKLIQSGIAIKLIGLDATNCLPVNSHFLHRLAQQKEFLLSNLAGQFWASTVNSIPSYEYTYFMWDVLATSVLGIDPSAIRFEMMELDVAVTEPNAGQTFRSPGNNQWVNVAVDADKNQVLNYILQQFGQPLPD